MNTPEPAPTPDQVRRLVFTTPSSSPNPRSSTATRAPVTLPPAALDLTTQRGPQSSSARWLNIDVSRTSIERTPVKLNVSLRSNVISAVIAGVIYLIIYLA